MQRGVTGTERTALLVVIVTVLMVLSVMAISSLAVTGSAAPSNSAAGTSAASPLTTSIVPSTSLSPHPNEIVDYGSGLGGGGFSQSLDPAVQYDTVDGAVNINVAQTLITYNGSSTANLLPMLATCVPGNTSATNPDSCQAMYGSSLITYNGTTGFPSTYTFPIDAAAHFYDPGTGASWGVYPSDVYYSFVRALTYSFWFGAYPGWIQAQWAVPPTGNPSWMVGDDGIGVYDYGGTGGTNNSPTWVMSSMLVNDSTYCPQSVYATAHGCITFVVGRNGMSGTGPLAGGAIEFPFYLSTMIADGAMVEPAGWFQYQGSISSNANATVPGWPSATVAGGDGPTLLPGNANSTSSSAFQTALATYTPDYMFDFANNGNNWPGLGTSAGPNPNVQFQTVGSGPYYLISYSDATGYTLKANPAYQQPTGCKGQAACQPPANSYVANVHEYFSTTDTNAIAAMSAGTADFGGIFLPADLATFDSLVASNKINYEVAPSLSVFYQAPNLLFNVSAANTLTKGVGSTNVPGNFFDNIAVREFLITSVPYKTLNDSLLQLAGPTVNTTIDTGWLGGGAIPQGMLDLATGSPYYNYTIPWPSQNPITDASVNGSAAWWWQQATTTGSPYYDAAAAACTSSNPCTFPIIGEVGFTFLDDTIHFEIAEIKSLTGDAVQPFTMDLQFAQLGICNTAPNAPGTAGGGGTQNPCPTENLGWAPDYPDPTDYVPVFYYPDAIDTTATALGETMLLPALNSPSCPDYSAQGISGSYTQAALTYYAGLNPVPNDCQGVAYSVAVHFFQIAGATAPGAQRVALYHEANAIMYNLGLYIWNEQATTVVGSAPWISQAGINLNVMFGGGGMQPWYQFPANGAGTYSVTMSQTGLPAGTTWSFSVNGFVGASLGKSAYVTEPNGTYTYSVDPVPGYTLSNGTGTLTVAGGSVNAPAATFTLTQTPGKVTTQSVSWSYLSPLAYGLFGVFLVLTLVFLATTVVFARRGRRPPTPPESWKQEPPTSPPGEPPS